MGFICHNDDISSFRKGFVRFLKLLHGRKDNTVRLTTGKEITQILTALSVHRVLAQKVLALCKLSEKLIVQIVSVGQHNNRWTVQGFLKQMGIEHHRQRLAAALRMPKHTTLTIGDGSSFGGLDCLSYGEILMITSQYFEGVHTFVGKADEVLYQVKQTFLLEHPLKEGIELCVLRVLVASIDRFPFHEAIFARGDRTGFRGHLVTHNTDGIVDEHGRDFLHVVAELPVCSGRIGFFSGRRFQFHNNNRNTIQEKQDIRAFVAVFDERPLICYDKGVVVRILVINKIDDGGAFLAFLKIAHRNTVLQVVHKDSVFLHQFAVFKVLQLKKRITNSVLRQRTVQTIEGSNKFFLIQRIAKIPLYVGSVQMAVSHVAE